MNINKIKIKNTVFKTTANPWKAKVQEYVVNDSIALQKDVSIESLIGALNSSKDVYAKETSVPNVYSFNFKRDVFYSGKWTEISKVARGLFINTKAEEIVARGYEKFFNFKEREFNTIEWLRENLKFPVTAYEKYNGFLGLLGYDIGCDSLVFCSKSSTSSDFAAWFKEIFNTKFSGDEIGLKEFLKNEKLCFVFEVIDVVNDPHIIEYPNNRLVLLGAIKRKAQFEQASYEELKTIADRFGFEVKAIAKVFNDFDSFEKFINFEKDNMEYKHEGYVIEDSSGYMFKLKGKYYSFWKSLRSVKDKLARGNQITVGWAQDPLTTEIIGWMRNQPREALAGSIIDVRNAFEAEKK